jgi:hypothetical protein
MWYDNCSEGNAMFGPAGVDTMVHLPSLVNRRREKNSSHILTWLFGGFSWDPFFGFS